MNTEISDNIATRPTGWIYYDGHCAFCLRWRRRVEPPLLRHGFTFVPLQASWVKSRLKVPESELLNEMRLLLPDQRIFGGADAGVVLAKFVWWLWPLWLAGKIPGAMIPMRAGYRFMARNRHCSNGACAVAKQKSLFDWLPVLLLPLATLTVRDFLPNWIFMWLFVTAMFAGCKWLTWRRALAKHHRISIARSLGYLFAWPGMNADEFLTGRHDKKPRPAEWLLAAGRLLAGIVLVWLAAKTTLTVQPVVSAWIGMFGLTLILHFGVFHLAALAWQRAGVPAKPLMQSPLSATSLADFWGARWNTAFNKLIHDLAFRPFVPRVGVAWATFGVFAISGIIHELSISFPARGGYGLPFAYFALQGAGVVFERRKAGRALGLGHGVRGRLFMCAFTAPPAYWLFHPAFVHNVILPMLQTIGAI